MWSEQMFWRRVGTFLLAGGLAFAVPTAAQAASLYFDFRADGGASPSLTFSQDGVSVTASGFNEVERRLVHQSNWGLGVTAPGDSNSQIDGNPYTETLRLVFSEDIHVAGIQFEMMGGRGDDFSAALDGVMMVEDVAAGNGWWRAPSDWAHRGASQVDLIADHANDDFKVAGIRIRTWDTVPGIPEPSAALVFAAGALLVLPVGGGDVD